MVNLFTMHLHDAGMEPEDVLRELSQRLAEDSSFQSAKILGCMCSAPDPLSASVFARFLEKNAGDPGLFPATRELEREVIALMGSLLAGERAEGSLVSGGTEANILALWAARRRAGRGRRQVILPESAHYSFDKAADLMDLELVKIPLDDRFQMDARLAAQALSPRSMAIVGVAGSTGLGAVDPIEELSRLAERHDLYLHVDAAFGGFVLPFLEEAGYPSRLFDFSLPGVSSITIDPHKMGRAPIPAGCLLFRDEGLARFAATSVSYLTGGEAEQRTLIGTRPGAAVAAVWAALHRLGRAGFVRVVREAMELTHWLAQEIGRIPGFAVVTEPVMNLIGLRSLDLGSRELASLLRERGWRVAVFEDFVRIAVMPHLSRTKLEPFLESLRAIAGQKGDVSSLALPSGRETAIMTPKGDGGTIGTKKDL